MSEPTLSYMQERLYSYMDIETALEILFAAGYTLQAPLRPTPERVPTVAEMLARRAEDVLKRVRHDNTAILTATPYGAVDQRTCRHDFRTYEAHMCRKCGTTVGEIRAREGTLGAEPATKESPR